MTTLLPTLILAAWLVAYAVYCSVKGRIYVRRPWNDRVRTFQILVLEDDNFHPRYRLWHIRVEFGGWPDWSSPLPIGEIWVRFYLDQHTRNHVEIRLIQHAKLIWLPLLHIQHNHYDVFRIGWVRRWDTPDQDPFVWTFEWDWLGWRLLERYDSKMKLIELEYHQMRSYRTWWLHISEFYWSPDNWSTTVRIKGLGRFNLY